MKFQKPFKDHTEQVQLLIERGMEVKDVTSAIHYLKHLNYYRIGAYWLPFEETHNPHNFKTGVNFEQVLNLYIFDRELRLHVLDAIERIEISLKTQWAYHLARLYDPHAYMSRNLSKKDHWFRGNMEDLQKEYERSDEIFIQHYKSKYTDPSLPPCWAACEIMSLGLFSRWYKNLKPYRARTAIANEYQLDENMLEGFIEHLTYVRNICAHHNRLWNRRFTVTMPVPRTKPKDLNLNFNVDSIGKRKIYNTLVMLIYLLNIISLEHSWRTKLVELIERDDIDTTAMGFPDKWESLPIWA